MKAVLLHNDNLLPSIPTGHSVHEKETYANVKLFIELIKYEDHDWQICGDLKVIALLMRMHLVQSKYCCFLCLWDSRDGKSHYKRDKWPSKNLKPSERNVPNDSQVNTNYILHPPLHIKLELMKNFVKFLNKDDKAYKYLGSKFPRLRVAKIIRRESL
ncbi:uncharacterized protein TNCV_4264901 [Trichonephila clavipes]|nr:uncharacterized protein TNCV_4264901 [Trichonephila clavipes]